MSCGQFKHVSHSSYFPFPHVFIHSFKSFSQFLQFSSPSTLPSPHSGSGLHLSHISSGQFSQFSHSSSSPFGHFVLYLHSFVQFIHSFPLFSPLSHSSFHSTFPFQHFQFTTGFLHSLSHTPFPLLFHKSHSSFHSLIPFQQYAPGFVSFLHSNVH